MNKATIHESAWIDDGVEIGEQTKVWHFCHIQQGASIGKNCTIGQGVNIGSKVHISDRVKIQNHVSVFEGVILEEDVFVGPSAVFTNVHNPRSPFPADQYEKTIVHKGCSIGANSTIVCPREIGEWSMIGAGSVVTKDIMSHALVAGNPARQIGWVCKCGNKLNDHLQCPICQRVYIRKDTGLYEIEDEI